MLTNRRSIVVLLSPNAGTLHTKQLGFSRQDDPASPSGAEHVSQASDISKTWVIRQRKHREHIQASDPASDILVLVSIVYRVLLVVMRTNHHRANERAHTPPLPTSPPKAARTANLTIQPRGKAQASHPPTYSPRLSSRLAQKPGTPSRQAWLLCFLALPGARQPAQRPARASLHHDLLMTLRLFVLFPSPSVDLHQRYTALWPLGTHRQHTAKARRQRKLI